MTGTSAWDTRSVVRLFNALGAIVVFSVVFGAYGIQFIFLEPPCPLCLLIRIGMLATGLVHDLNDLFCPKPIHYGFALLGAIFGILVSLRNIALHIVPGTGAYGDAVFGFHLYTWAFLVFMAMTIASSGYDCGPHSQVFGQAPALPGAELGFKTTGVGLCPCARKRTKTND
ncbi:MAG: disulfide bond formation protein B [Solirubrobacterales bacterium]